MDDDRPTGFTGAEGDRLPAPAGRTHLPRAGWGGQDDRAAAYWRAAGTPMPPDMRDFGARQARRASNWTAAALVAGVAVTTGYLAHTAPAGTSASVHKRHGHHHRGAATRQAGQTGQTGVAPTYVPPPVRAPVVTSGGSGARGGGGGD